MLRIHFKTGTAWTKSIEVEGHLHSDLLQLIDDYYSNQGDLPVPMYTIEDITKWCENDFGEVRGSEVEYYLETMTPINGGEYYIDGIEWVEAL